MSTVFPAEMKKPIHLLTRLFWLRRGPHVPAPRRLTSLSRQREIGTEQKVDKTTLKKFASLENDGS